VNESPHAISEQGSISGILSPLNDEHPAQPDAGSLNSGLAGIESV
jgi:hypothetical protein